MRHNITRMSRVLPALLLAACLPCGAAEPATPAPAAPLNLRLPDITTLLTQEQIAVVLAGTRDPDVIDEVEVEGVRPGQPRSSTPVIRSPQVAPGIFAPFWAIMNPLQAWRIIAPIPGDQARYIGNIPPDATDNARPLIPPP